MRRAAILLPLAFAACTPSAPSGQVVARVNGEEITRRDLQVELLSSGAPADVDLESVQGALLERVITRKLLAAQARRVGIDRTPDYLATMRRYREVLLTQALERRATDLDRAPGKAEIVRYIAARTAAFDNRKLVLIDRIEAAIPPIPLATVAKAKSNDEIAAILARHGHGIRRSQVTVDTLASPNFDAAGEAPRISTANGTLRSDAILSVEAIPVPPQDREAIARSMLLNARAQAWTTKELARLRGAAEVEYQAGFGPKN